MNDIKYSLIIIGGGPAGCAAAVYASRKKIKSGIITNDWGGQSVVSNDVQNWIGIPHISGVDIANNLKNHVKEYSEDVLDIIEGDVVYSIDKKNDYFVITTKKGDALHTKAIIVCSGASRRTLDVDGASRLNHKGISYCASCDAPLFKGVRVVVIGGGNAGFESALQLLDYATEVYLFERGDFFRADSITIEKALHNPRMKALKNVSLTEVRGENKVESVIYSSGEGSKQELSVGGVFVEIGSIPNTDFLHGKIDLNNNKEIVTDSKTQRTSIDGIWAAGDATDGLYRQNNISMGDAVKALEDIYLWLHKK